LAAGADTAVHTEFLLDAGRDVLEKVEQVAAVDGQFRDPAGIQGDVSPPQREWAPDQLIIAPRPATLAGGILRPVRGRPAAAGRNPSARRIFPAKKQFTSEMFSASL